MPLPHSHLPAGETLILTERTPAQLDELTINYANLRLGALEAARHYADPAEERLCLGCAIDRANIIYQWLLTGKPLPRGEGTD